MVIARGADFSTLGQPCSGSCKAVKDESGINAVFELKKRKELHVRHHEDITEGGKERLENDESYKGNTTDALVEL